MRKDENTKKAWQKTIHYHHVTIRRASNCIEDPNLNSNEDGVLKDAECFCSLDRDSR